MKRVLLGVNIDRVATLRQARGTRYPEPVQAALIAEQAGADGITVHLREDRRHINDRDVALLLHTSQTRINLEMAATDEMIAIASRPQPPHCCVVPGRREDLDAEGGRGVDVSLSRKKDVCPQLREAGIEVALCIDAEPARSEAAVACAAPAIEIHTGQYAEAVHMEVAQTEL